jgi:hypothetical protein
MEELSVVVDFSREVGIVFLSRLEHDLGAIGELMSGKIDLTEASFSNQAAKGIVADGVEVDGGEFVQ